MRVQFSQFTRLVAIVSLATGAVPGHAEAGDGAISTRLKAADFAATPGQVRKPGIRLSLTDPRASVKASLWATHLLKSSSRETISPENLQASSGFEMTGPFLERSAGIRLELEF
jgi:hypothetical protein